MSDIHCQSVDPASSPPSGARGRARANASAAAPQHTSSIETATACILLIAALQLQGHLPRLLHEVLPKAVVWRLVHKTIPCGLIDSPRRNENVLRPECKRVIAGASCEFGNGI